MTQSPRSSQMLWIMTMSSSDSAGKNGSDGLSGSDEAEISTVISVRELYMMRIMEAVTDKPNWDTKVRFSDRLSP